MQVDLILSRLDLASVVVFAIAGALAASRKQMDIVGFCWLSVVTGAGGGTLRDLLLDVPVFWVKDPTPLTLCLIVAGLVHFIAHLVSSRYRLLLYLDAIGLALVTISGTAKGLDTGGGPMVALVMGVITAAFGGILRDLLGQEPSILLRRDICVSAAAAGSALFLFALEMGMAKQWALGLCAVLILRGLAIWFNWSLPAFKPRPGRQPDREGETGQWGNQSLAIRT